MKKSETTKKKVISVNKATILLKTIEGKEVSEVWTDFGTFFLEFGLPTEKNKGNHRRHEFCFMIGTPYTFLTTDNFKCSSDDESNKRETFLISLKGRIISNILLEPKSGSLGFMLDDITFQQSSKDRSLCDWALYLVKDPTDNLVNNIWLYPNSSDGDFILENSDF